MRLMGLNEIFKKKQKSDILKKKKIPNEFAVSCKVTHSFRFCCDFPIKVFVIVFLVSYASLTCSKTYLKDLSFENSF